MSGNTHLQSKCNLFRAIFAQCMDIKNTYIMSAVHVIPFHNNMRVTFYSFYIFPIREENNSISVVDLSEESRPIPNPVRTFSHAFESYRKSPTAFNNIVPHLFIINL